MLQDPTTRGTYQYIVGSLNFGAAGTPSALVELIQGAQSMTPLNVVLYNLAGANLTMGAGISTSATTRFTAAEANDTSAGAPPTTTVLLTQGSSAKGAAITGSPVGNGCRTATVLSTPVADGQGVFNTCGAEGKQIVMPYSIKEAAWRATASVTTTAATTLQAAAATGIKNYVTAVQCFSTATAGTVITLNDTAATQLFCPRSNTGGSVFPTPLLTAAATAVTTLTVNSQNCTGQ